MTLREVDPVRPGGLRWLSLVLNRGRVRSAPARHDRFVDPLFQANDRAKHDHIEGRARRDASAGCSRSASANQFAKASANMRNSADGLSSN